MSSFFSDIRSIFGKEKSYVFLLIVIVFFYGVILGWIAFCTPSDLAARIFSKVKGRVSSRVGLRGAALECGVFLIVGPPAANRPNMNFAEFNR